jgi:hypothetical protein
MRNVFGRTRAPRVAASAREDSSAPRPRRGRARRVAVPPPGAFREDERGSGAATTTAEPDPKSPRVPSNASETNIPSAEAAEAAGASGGWWAWTKRWALGDSDEDSDEDELSSSGGHDTPAAGQDDAAAPRGDAEASFLNRVPLPPWLKDQAAARVFSDDPAEALTSLTETLTETLTEQEKKSEEAVENRTPRTAVGVGSITVTRDADAGRVCFRARLGPPGTEHGGVRGGAGRRGHRGRRHGKQVGRARGVRHESRGGQARGRARGRRGARTRARAGE